MNAIVRTTYAWAPVWLVSFSLLLLLIILPLTSENMTYDGSCYAALAKNLSLGYGSLWKPYYTQTRFTAFYEHPPLALFFQSLFFKKMGSGLEVERIYTFLMACGQFALIGWYWLKKQQESVSSLSLLLLLWLLIPLNYLYTKNMLGCTLTLFTTFASLALLWQSKSKTSFYIQNILAAIAVVVAFFCDGPVALFVLSVPFLSIILNENPSIRVGIHRSLWFAVILAFCFATVYYVIPEALENTQNYFKEQVLASVTGERDLAYAGWKHFDIIFRYARNYIGISAFVGLIIAVACHLKGSSFRETLIKGLKNRSFLFFLLLSLISALPVGISHRQASRYLMQSAPFFNLAAMILCFESAQVIVIFYAKKLEDFKKSFYTTLTAFTLCLLVFIALLNGYNLPLLARLQAKDHDVLHDINYLSHYLKDGTILSLNVNYWYYKEEAYFARRSMISLTPRLGQHYCLSLKTDPLPEQYRLIKLPLQYYNLSEKI